jgi:hypothetical protein
MMAAAGGPSDDHRPHGALGGLLRRPRRRLARRLLQPQMDGRVESEETRGEPDLLEGFRFFAVLGTWMEEDIVEATVRNAFAQGVEAVYLVDNASTDATVERAVAAGATVAESFDTEQYQERVRILLMNSVVERQSLTSGADHVWWLWLDADEFPEGPGGMTIAEYLATLDRRFRLVGSTYYNHFPAALPAYLPGFHPLDFQPLCELFMPERPRFCDQSHWKHPLQRFDRHGSTLLSLGGFHSATTWTPEPVIEPLGGIVTHHVQYREEAFTRLRMERLCGGKGRNHYNDSIGNTEIQSRFDSLDAVYAKRWDQVQNQRRSPDVLGVAPSPWPDSPSTRRWYSADALRMAKDRMAKEGTGPSGLARPAVDRVR